MASLVKKKEKLLYFPTIKKVLDRSFAITCAHRGITEEEAAGLFVKHLKNMSDEWFSGRTPNIAYGDPLCRLAYLYCHVPVNANLFEHVIRCTRPLEKFVHKKLEEDGELRVCAFGGGPGTECLGLAKHLWNTRQGEVHANVSFTVLDRVTEWGETWDAIEHVVRDFLKRNCGLYKDWPFSFNKTFTNIEIGDCSKFGNLAEIFGQDLFVFNYFLSELYGDFAKLQPVFQAMVNSAPKGSYVLFIDREERKVIGQARQLFEDNKLIEEKFETTTGNMDTNEESSDLEPYVSKIGRRPRVTWGNRSRGTGWGAFWLAGRKK